MAAFVLSALIMRSMLRRNLWLQADVPNIRSMHRRTIPRGGGIALVVSTLVVYTASYGLGGIATSGGFGFWFLMPFAVMAATGWLDDRCNLAILPRFAIQVVTALLVYFLLASSVAELMSSPLKLVFFGFVTTFVLVWCINLYNFMDGMDGLAASQAIVVCATLAVWFYASGALAPAIFSILLAASSAAFLLHNWHPARVFMGDTGSLAIGGAIGALTLGGYLFYGISPVASAILMGVFLFDASVTLVRRMIAGEQWWQSHRSHFYQRARDTGFTQRQIVGSVIVLDLLLALISTTVVLTGEYAFLAALVSVSILSLTALVLTRLEKTAASGATE